MNGREQAATRKMLCGFFTLHAGVFILVHLLFLWILFSGEWLKKVHGFASFMQRAVRRQRTLVALLFMFASGWISYLRQRIAGLSARHGARALSQEEALAQAPDGGSDTVGSIVGGLYVRIVIMQIAIIAGAIFANPAIGSGTPSSC